MGQPARLCAAIHGHLLLLDLEDGTSDAQVGQHELRSRHYAKILVSEPVVELLWRDAMLCVAHVAFNLVLDANSGREIWRLHLRSPSRPLSNPPLTVAALPVALSCSEGVMTRNWRSYSFFGSVQSRRVRNVDVHPGGTALLSASLLSAGLFIGCEGGTAAAKQGEVVLVEQMVWVQTVASSSHRNSHTGNGSANCHEIGPRGGGYWIAEQNGRCWLDVRYSSRGSISVASHPSLPLDCF